MPSIANLVKVSLSLCPMVPAGKMICFEFKTVPSFKACGLQIVEITQSELAQASATRWCS
jgi:hypothetical protein